jgi:biopolymer transport protein ExbD
MKRHHLIAILAGVVLALVVAIGVPALIFLQWRQAREVAREEMNLRVAVPTSTHPRDEVHPIIINIDAGGRFTVDDKVLSEDEIRGKLWAISRLYEDQPILLRADGKTSWKTMTHTIDIIEKSGLWNISFATRKTSPK